MQLGVRKTSGYIEGIDWISASEIDRTPKTEPGKLQED